MGRGSRAGKVTKQAGPRNIFTTTDRTVKRDELNTIASLCGTTRETIGSVISDATLTDAYNDNGAAATANERASDTGTSTATV